MTGMKHRRTLVIVVCAIATWLTIIPVFAQPQQPVDEEVRRILEKSLSVVEIDKEIARIVQQQTAISTKLVQSQSELDKQKASIAEHQEKAGAVLRAYYTGERDFMLTAVLSSDNLSSLLTMVDYFDFIFSNDQLTLNTYTKQYRELKKEIDKLDAQSEQLAEVQKQLTEQRSRVAALQEDVDSQLSGRSDADKLLNMINEFNDYWKNVGLLEVKRYFSALSKAMNKMPAWVQDNKDMLEIDGFNYTLTVSDDQLNTFLREQNELFNNFAFAFHDDSVEVSGKRDGMEVKLSGHYTVEKTGAILFHVDELIFNGLALPDTTRHSLEKEFDLGFYPQKMVSFLRTKSVQTENGKLIVKLSISL
ncbi:coiled-coil domain-containing protein [Paenibacillus solisilvae]|uniref:Coiled-coil domain-containing protein n=1 Tax=Paenibacillus solisilvae TaxID=2486751 RepID=A0ABW0W0N0_9BACL